MSVFDESLKLHEKNKGKIEVISKVKVENMEDLSLAYSPGVAEPCKRIAENKENVYKYTSKGNMIAVVTDGSAVLGLGNIGPEAALPVMEGKAILFKEFAGVDAFPICLDTQDTEEIIRTVKLLAPGLGGINLEDISAPRCIEIESRLKKELDIPVFHDDQHGTAIVVTAGLINAYRFLGKNLKDARVVVNGAGAAGSSICKMIKELGVSDIIAVDKTGILNRDDIKDYNELHKELAEITNINNKKGTLSDALEGSDIFIGVSAGNILKKDMVKKMNKDAVIFAMANPVPEIMPEDALEAGAVIVGTGRSDYPNQINNVLAFPGLFKGALEAKSKKITEDMKIEAAKAIAYILNDDDLKKDYIIPDVFDKRVVESVAEAVKKVAVSSGICR
ncbi:NADP-dependent malic enzyme [Sebaldella termitidis]|uniref:Malate dehydrogenase (Oxaloacetate-decarboxylating) n=1 Tax=Sebaldella termitidis (strain ATCC 33386 / NCTC 11300) TaxID=526218 RepID=D1AJC4_SEBTE|nr:NADP-dependent malic enzyme [Sebaldella termitidis]ACZ08812.1 Malate dehydrogenase (oxaloacetate- decarboxylating) [Sebaldella termitidis ATCC 33386]SUI24131.1 NADP-dependent malic enzyme [Sebaldella termitidis]